MQIVGIDCRFASVPAGLGTFTRELVSALLKRPDPWQYVLFVRSKDEPWIATLPKRPEWVVEAPYRHYSLSEQIRFPAAIRDAALDLFYSPHFNVPLACPVPFVCTIHDLILHDADQGLFKQRAYRFLLQRVIRSATAIVTVSTYSKDAIVRTFGESVRLKIAIVSPGVAAPFHRRTLEERQAVIQKYQIAQPFLLSLVSAKRHKNVPLLLSAFASLKRPELSLVFASSESLGLSLPPSVTVIESFSHGDLPALYSAARGYVSASAMEGFGLPMIEAMACGCPVVATRVGGVPEACGSAAIFVEPTQDGLASGMAQLLATDPQRMMAAGFAQAKKFSWEESARRVAEIFAPLLSSYALQ